MKISKVDHTRTGVGVSRQGLIQGILYEDPKKNSSRDLERRIEDRINATKRLYNVFNAKAGGNSKADKEIAFAAREFTNCFRISLKELKNQSRNLDGLDAQKLYDALAKNHKNVEVSDASVDLILAKSLKKSLQRDKIRAALKTLLLKVYAKGGSKPLSDDEKKIIQQDFVYPMLEDFLKSKIKTNAKKSLENQNLVVQPCDNLITTAKTTKSKTTKKTEKDAFRKFLSDYAVLDKDARTQMLVKIRRLVNLYFYGKDEAQKEIISVWNEHEDKRRNTTPFNSYKKERNASDKIRIAELIRSENIKRYRNAIAVSAADTEHYFDQDLNKFFVHHIENEVERVYALNNSDEEFKLQTGYISEKVWKGIINYMSVKYIAVGKAVFQYAMNELPKESGDIKLGVIDDNYAKGISSFEYERIKAEETLQRTTAVYLAFAVNHLSRATMDLSDASENESDMLLMKPEQIEKYIKDKDSIRRNILQFFGGASSWEETLKSYFEVPGNDLKFLDELRTILYSLRNENFHFKTMKVNEGDWNKELIATMFAQDCKRAGETQKNKFYSNNLPMFYNTASLEKVIKSLYFKFSDRMSQVPAFNAVFVRKEFPNYLSSNGINPAFGTEDKLIWQNAVYYLYKEVYYHAFLQDEQVKEYFYDYLKSEENKIKGENDPKKLEPIKDFNGRIEELKKFSLSEICQFIMTEYNRQNSGSSKKQSAEAQSRNPKIFQHYKMLLLKGIQGAFSKYISENADLYEFIKHPVLIPEEQRPSAEEFLPDYVTKQYQTLSDKLSDSAELQKWYVMTRLLSPKQSNHLAGCLRDYKTYTRDIARRAEETGNPLVKKDNIFDEDIIRVVDLSTRLNGATSNIIEDYFTDKEDYATYVGKFVDYGQKDGDTLPSGLLSAFCEEEIEGKKVGVYFDGRNPIPNRNIIMTKLYGASEILSDVLPPVKREEIVEYHKLDKAIEKYKVSGNCSNEDEQKSLKKYQELKNHIELRDVTEYAELIDEFQGQMVEWGYLRERDLMYFQLGFHYLCLNNNSDKKDGYDKLKTDSKSLSGAILYQIAAMYIGGVPVYVPEGDTYKEGKVKEGTGSKINLFESYAQSIQNEKYGLYTAGLELFENVDEHDNIVKLRNYIDHFHYYTDHDRSLLDLYSEIFDRFFSYDMKYRKNVPNLIYNILLSHFVKAKLTFNSGKKEIGLDDSKKTKSRANIEIKAEGGIESEPFTFKTSDGKEVLLPARNSAFLWNVARILYYTKGMPKLPDTMVRENSNYTRLSGNKPAGGNRNSYSNKPNKRERDEGRKALDEYNKKGKGDDFKVTMSFAGIDFSKLPKG